MADSRIVKIHKKIAELVSVDFAGGHSGLDFSNRGFRFVQLDNIMIPSVGIKFVDSLEENTYVTLGRYRGTAIFEVYAFCGGTTNEARTVNAALYLQVKRYKNPYEIAIAIFAIAEFASEFR